jgi:AcrR family transcriptional regulator
MRTSERRETLKEALIAGAERTIAAHGLAALKARDLAAAAGCAVGAIYNVVADLDDLVIAVNGRTLAALGQALGDAAGAGPKGGPGGADQAVAGLVRMAAAYLDFAAVNTQRWRTLFDHRLPDGRPPEWYVAQQAQLFAHVEGPLHALRPGLAPAALALSARSLFSAVHGIVSLGLEEKLGVIPLQTLRAQIAEFVSAMARGLSATARRPARGRRSHRARAGD